VRPSNTLIQQILSSGKIGLAELYDITLATGQTYHFSSSDAVPAAVTVLTPQGSTGPFSYASGFIITRGKITQKTGVEAGHLEVAFAPQLNYPGGAPTIAGYPIQQAARYGFLDGARFSYNELYLNPAIGANASAVGFFSGTIQDIQADRLAVHLTVEDFLAYLGNQQMPRPLFGTGCIHTVYDQGCTLLKSLFTVSGALTSVGDNAHFVAGAMTQPAGYFKLGQLTFTSGANNGVAGPVNSFGSGGAFAMGFPFPVTPSPGDTFTVWPGCDLQETTCQNSNAAVGPPFNNGAHFSATPFTPQPLTLLDAATDNPPAQVPGATAGQVIGSKPTGQLGGYGPFKP
jgi:hypothetical protein